MAFIKRLSVALATLLLLCVEASPAWAQDVPADWLKQPSRQELMSVWPASAFKTGHGGKALLSCTVTAQGALRDCRVLSETPQGAGFGGAALTLSAQFAMKPATRAGRPVDSQVKVPIVFPDFDIPTGTRMRGQGMFAAIPDRVISGVRWSTAPSFSDVLAVYPEKARAAKISGRTTLDCLLAKDGTIGRCNVLQEDPASNGFGSAARKLAPKFVGPTADREGNSLAGAHVQIPFVFAAESLAGGPPLIGRPQWIELPRFEDMKQAFPAAAKQHGLMKARVVLSCTVATGGGLEGCTVESEDPAGHGIGKATAGLAGTFKLGVWAAEGLPTVGGTVRVPIRYDFTEEPAPARP